MLKYILIITASIIIISALIKADNNAAMRECQKTHSFETCFYTLNH